MVCYCAENLYQDWTTGGPHGAVYAATKSGWFDMPAFEVWFNSVFLEALKIVLEENSLFNKTPDLF